MASIVNKTAQADYTQALELRDYGAAGASVTVTGAAAVCQIGRGRPPLWEEEEVLLPGVSTYERRVDAIRVRALSPAQLPQVSIATVAETFRHA